MRIAIHFIFSPSPWLVEAASAVGETWLVEPSVWTTHETDRTGLEHSQKDLENAFWLRFTAYLFNDEETKDQENFRNLCIEKGLSGCWSVVKTKGGGAAEDLMECGKEAKNFLLTRLSPG